MSTNLIRRNQGDNIWAGYQCFRVYSDNEGKLFPGGAKYVVFDNGNLVAVSDTLTEADKAWNTRHPYMTTGIRLSEYKGIDARLRI
jgi:hypothetical protein